MYTKILQTLAIVAFAFLVIPAYSHADCKSDCAKSANPCEKLVGEARSMCDDEADDDTEAKIKICNENCPAQ